MDYIERQIKQAGEAFANHVATLERVMLRGSELLSILWAKPGTSNMSMSITIHRGRVFIYGDLGEAIYNWYGDIGIDFFPGINMQYFFSKCEASEFGRKPTTWDSDEALEWIKKEKRRISADKSCDEYPKGAAKAFREIKDEMVSATEQEWMWHGFLASHEREVCDVWGQDWWERDVTGPGEVYAPRSIMHYVGIKMACAALLEAGNAQPKEEISCEAK